VLEVGGFLKTTGLRAGAQRAFSSSSSDIGADERSIQMSIFAVCCRAGASIVSGERGFGGREIGDIRIEGRH
jgi:hypothetical protein